MDFCLGEEGRITQGEHADAGQHQIIITMINLARKTDERMIVRWGTIANGVRSDKKLR